MASSIACGLWLATAPAARAAAAPADEARPGALGTIALPGGVDALAAAAGLPVPAPRATVALEVIRRLYSASAGDAASAARRQAVASVLAQPAAAAGDTIPLPFDDGLWSRVIFSRKVPPAGVATAILTTARGAWFYYGAVGLDDETRAWFRLRPHRLLRIGAQVGAFAAFGPSLRVRADRIASPGGPAADPLWETLVGASPANAEAFVDKVLEARAGRIAWLYDTVARLDAGAQRHLLEGEGNLDRLRRLADVFARVNPEWRIEDRPLWRPLVDPATLLLELDVRSDGTLVLPEPAAWAGTLGRPQQIDASWFVDRVFSGDGANLRERVDLVLFAMRWTRDGREPASGAVLDLFSAAPAVALALERIGVRDNAVAGRLHGLVQRPALRDDPHAMRLVQASLALVERPVLAGSIDASVAAVLLTALAERVEAAGAAKGVAAWLSGALKPAIASLAPTESFDTQLVMALAGRSPADPVRVEWEGQRYNVDRPAATRARMERVREAQGRPSVTDALGDATALGEALMALIYASALPATDPELLASRAETRHGFGPARGAHDGRAWRLAEATSSAGVAWHLDGSLLGLDVALAVPALRRVSDDPPAPTLPAADRVAFARTVALLPAGRLTDASRDLVLGLVDAGRRRLAAVSNVDQALALADAAGLGAWRREALAWAVVHDAASLPTALSLSELAWAGDPRTPADRAALDAWGTSRLAATGELATRAPRGRGWEVAVAHDARAGLATSIGDLNLRIAAFLAARKLPGSIAPDLLSAATLDLIDRVSAPRADDWRAVVAGIRTMPETRFEDDIAALTADGPLRPVRERETGQ
ncbi:MAG: hypothetical protein ABIT71_13800 [Vicinamibacteraceae bacterium]